jgi:chemotaxis protein MotB
LLGGLLLVFAAGGCVSKKKYEALLAERDSIQQACNQQERQMQAQIDNLLKAKANREDSIASLQAQRKALVRKQDSLERRYENLQRTYHSLKDSSKEEVRDLVERLETLQQDLYNRETRLRQVQRRLNARDSVLKALRKRLSDAFEEFDQQGIAVQVEGDEVKVSIADRLLFERGKTHIDQEGKSALQQLGSVLKQTKSLNVIVEGHTDSLAVADLGCIDDNWELSVLRAVEVVRYLVRDQSVPPDIFTAAGRGKHYPVATNETPEGRAKNRRTEIILAPELDPIFQLIDLAK